VAAGEPPAPPAGVFAPAVGPPPGDPHLGRWFLFRDAELLVHEPRRAGEAIVPHLTDPGDLGLSPIAPPLYLGTLDGDPCWTARLTDEAASPPPGMAFHGLRELHGRLPEAEWAVAGRAVQLLAWDRDHRFCGRCATPTNPLPGERAKRCPTCGLTAFPRISPAVIVLIERDDTILLARGHQFAAGRFGLVAGFVETGESLEDAVRREIAEEVGIAVEAPRYFGSQPWPFPHGIMVGFTAAHAAGEITIQEAELAEAAWFGLADLPRIPPKLSIARRLIDSWAAARGATIGQP